MSETHGHSKSLRTDADHWLRDLTNFVPPFYWRFKLEHYPSPACHEAMMHLPTCRTRYIIEEDGAEPKPIEHDDFRPGLLLCGPSRRGKTMLAWQWIRRLFTENAVQNCVPDAASIFATDGLGWKTLCWQNATKIETWEPFINELTISTGCHADGFGIVLLDDLDKD